jgi:hypothetical protein
MTKENTEEYSTPTSRTAAVVSDLQERLRVQSEALNAKSLAMDTLRYQLTMKLEDQKSRLLKLARRVNTLTREKEAVWVKAVGVQKDALQFLTSPLHERVLSELESIQVSPFVAPLSSNSFRQTQRSPSPSQSSTSTILAQDIRFVEFWENPDHDIQLQSLVPALIRLCDERERDREKERVTLCLG